MATHFSKLRNNRMVIKLFFLLIIHTGMHTAQAGSPKINSANPAYQEYIETYYKMAIEQQKRYKIPASITLAQALLESAAGQSYLALAGNNHFGLKCKEDTKGLTIYKNDDGQYTPFRKYLYVNDSYEDRSLFLKERPNYRALFKLKVTDYKGWARGLGQCGYATDPDYTSKLIKLIEAYQLYYYDTLNEKTQLEVTTPAAKTEYASNQPVVSENPDLAKTVIAEVSKSSNAPKVTNATNASNTPKATNVINATNTPKVTNATNASKTSNAPKVTDASKKVGAPKTSNATKPTNTSASLPKAKKPETPSPTKK